MASLKLVFPEWGKYEPPPSKILSHKFYFLLKEMASLKKVFLNWCKYKPPPPEIFPHYKIVIG